jgi:hypothetical protein
MSADVDTRSDLRQRHKGESFDNAKEQVKQKAKEFQPQAEQLLRKGEMFGKDAYNKVCDTCHQLQHYPKLMTVLIILSAFLLGVGCTAMAGRMGYFVPSTGHFTRDKTAVEAHAALDTLLRNMYHAKGKLNDKFHDTADSLHLARETLINIMAAKAGSWKDSLQEGAEHLKDKTYETAAHLREMANEAADRVRGVKPEPTISDKIRDTIHDARDAVNDQYYNIKGKVLGKEKEIEEGTIKSTLHKAENKIKDMLHMQ